MSPVLAAKGLYCERDYRLLFEKLDFTVNTGDVWQIAGHNGVGKTSLIRGLCGMNADVRGDWSWFGQAWPTARFEFARQSLYMGHYAGVKAALTPRENLRWFFDLRQNVSDQDLDNALASFQLQGYEDTPCYSLSAGQQRRVALARLAVSDAKVWVLDEPFTAIDLDGVHQLEVMISEFAAKGGTVLLTSHHRLTAIPQLQQLNLEDYRAH